MVFFIFHKSFLNLFILVKLQTGLTFHISRIIRWFISPSVCQHKIIQRKITRRIIFWRIVFRRRIICWSKIWTERSFCRKWHAPSNYFVDYQFGRSTNIWRRRICTDPLLVEIIFVDIIRRLTKVIHIQKNKNKKYSHFFSTNDEIENLLDVVRATGTFDAKICVTLVWTCVSFVSLGDLICLDISVSTKIKTLIWTSALTLKK